MESPSGKLLVYTSSFTSHGKRLTHVSSAVEKMAKVLKANVEVVTFRKKFMPIYVYYKNGDEEPIPIYYNNGEESETREICVTLRNMMFVLSFHPKHAMLRHLRKEIMQFS